MKIRAIMNEKNFFIMRSSYRISESRKKLSLVFEESLRCCGISGTQIWIFEALAL